ncbi:MAG: hypothetical protein NC127_08890, partial [Muribaculum sp.]|nr:hypothetical protein [Muribaculum sp.]
IAITRRIASSYEAYLRWRAHWHNKGYGLDRQLTIEEYAIAHTFYAHKYRGAQHIAREIASADRTFTRGEAAQIVRRLKDAAKYDDVDQELLNDLRRRYKRAKDIYSLELTPDEAAASEQERRDRLIARGKTPDYVIQANARAKLFNELLDAGLSYKEAETVIYG